MWRSWVISSAQTAVIIQIQWEHKNNHGEPGSCVWVDGVRGGDRPRQASTQYRLCLACSAIWLAWGGAVPPLLTQVLCWGWRIQGGMGNWAWWIWAPAKAPSYRNKAGLAHEWDRRLSGGREQAEEWKSMWSLLSSLLGPMGLICHKWVTAEDPSLLGSEGGLGGVWKDSCCGKDHMNRLYEFITSSQGFATSYTNVRDLLLCPISVTWPCDLP